MRNTPCTARRLTCQRPAGMQGSGSVKAGEDRQLQQFWWRRAPVQMSLCAVTLPQIPANKLFYFYFFHLNFVSPQELSHDLSEKFGLPSNRILLVVACCHIDRPCDKDIRCDFPLLVCWHLQQLLCVCVQHLCTRFCLGEQDTLCGCYRLLLPLLIMWVCVWNGAWMIGH